MTLPDGVRRICKNAFTDCSVLAEVVIPASVEYIEAQAFDCSNVTYYCKAASQPEGWAENWHGKDSQIYWNY